MVNQIEYVDTSFAMAGCAFLLDTGNEILAATGKHVLRYFRSESMNTVSVGKTLEVWRMYRKDAPASVAVVGQIINEDESESLEHIVTGEDWLLLTVEEYTGDVQPLRLRATLPEPGEEIFIVGWRYTDEGRQKVYPGKVVDTGDGSILVSTEALAENRVPGLSGSPVVDVNGDVVGIMSSKAGKMERLASVAYPTKILEERRNRGVVSHTRVVNPTVPPAPSGVGCPDEPSVCIPRITAHFRERGWVGITPEIDPATGSISVTRVFPGSPAETAGIRVGDIVLGLNGIRRDSDPEAFMRVYNSFRPGDSVIFNVERGGTTLEVTVRLEPIPEDVLAQWVEEHLSEFHPRD